MLVFARVGFVILNITQIGERVNQRGIAFVSKEVWSTRVATEGEDAIIDKISIDRQIIL